MKKMLLTLSALALLTGSAWAQCDESFYLDYILPPGPQTSTTYALGPNYTAAPLSITGACIVTSVYNLDTVNQFSQKRSYLATPYPKSFVVGTPWECQEYVTIQKVTQGSPPLGQAPLKFNFDWQKYVPGVESSMYLGWVYYSIPYTRGSDVAAYCDATRNTIFEMVDQAPC